MTLRRILVLAVLLLASGAWGQVFPPGQTAGARHGMWVSGSVDGIGRHGCFAGTAAPPGDMLQIIISEDLDGVISLLLNIGIQNVVFDKDEAVIFFFPRRAFYMQGRAYKVDGSVIMVFATDETEAQTIAELLDYAREGGQVRIDLGITRSLTFSLTGAAQALAALRSCVQQRGVMPR